MLGHNPFLSDETAQYLAALLPVGLPDEAAFALAPPGAQLQPTVGSLTAAMLDVLVRAKRPARILELGTALGYSAIVMGQAARAVGGRVISVELDAHLASAARENVRAAGLLDVVEVLQADANALTRTVAGPFGLIVQDANKSNYETLLPHLVALLEPGGLLVSDDTLFPLADLPDSVRHWQRAMADYNQALRRHPQLRTCWLPLGWGVAVSVKLGTPP